MALYYSQTHEQKLLFKIVQKFRIYFKNRQTTYFDKSVLVFLSVCEYCSLYAKDLHLISN